MAPDFDFEVHDGKNILIKYNGNDPHVVIPDDVDVIEKSAFMKNQTLVSVLIPGNVTEIEGEFLHGAFRDCHNLVSVTILEGLKRIGDGTFSGCTSLTNIEIPGSVLKIGEYAFSGCTGLTSLVIPEGVKEIESGVFRGCTSLIDIQIPSSIIKIGGYAFSGCTGLTSLVIPDGVKEIELGILEDCTSLIDIQIPSSVMKIGWDAFSGCTGLTSLVIPEGVKEIESSAFKGSTSLIDVQIPGSVMKIGWDAFFGCTGLTSVIIHEGVNEIAAEAFKNCTSLINVQIPDTITEIGKDVFSSTPFFDNIPCELKVAGRFLLAYTGQESIIRIPQGVSVISNGAFTGNAKITSVVLPKGIAAINSAAFQNCKNLKELEITYHHESTEKSKIQRFGYIIIKLLNQENRHIGTLYMLNSKKDIAYLDFLSNLLSGRVEHLSKYDTLFSSSDEVVAHKARAAVCRLKYPLELEEKYKNEYILYLQNNAHFIIPGLIQEGDIASINFIAGYNVISKDGINTWIDLAKRFSKLEILAFLRDYKNKTWGQEPPLEIGLTENTNSEEWATCDNVDGSINITRYLGSQQTVTIPSRINGKKVYRIAGSIGSLKCSVFFMHKDFVQSVIIKDGIEVIDERAFLECQNLQSVEIPESVKEIGKDAFCGCPNVVIRVPKGAYAIDYAKRINIEYVEL